MGALGGSGLFFAKPERTFRRKAAIWRTASVATAPARGYLAAAGGPPRRQKGSRHGQESGTRRPCRRPPSGRVHRGSRPAGDGDRRRPFLARLFRYRLGPFAPQPRASGQARGDAGAYRRLACRPSRHAARSAGLSRLSGGDRLYPPRRPGFRDRDGEYRPRVCPHRRAPTGRADHECALCPERRQCALGLALRCALRHRRAGRPAIGQGL